MAFVLPAFVAKSHMNSLGPGLYESIFSNVVILCCVPLVALNSLTFWGMVLLEYLVVLIIRHNVI